MPRTVGGKNDCTLALVICKQLKFHKQAFYVKSTYHILISTTEKWCAHSNIGHYSPGPRFDDLILSTVRDIPRDLEQAVNLTGRGPAMANQQA